MSGSCVNCDILQPRHSDHISIFNGHTGTDPVSGDDLVNKEYTDNLVGDVLSVKNFGAVGDATTDDSAAFIAWIAALGSFATSPGYGIIPAGVYKIDSPLVLDMSAAIYNGARIKGAGARNTLLDMRILAGPTTDVAFSVTATSSTWGVELSDFSILSNSSNCGLQFGNPSGSYEFSKCVLRNIRVANENTTTTGACVFKCFNTVSSVFDNLYMTGYMLGTTTDTTRYSCGLSGALYNTFNSCTFDNNNTALAFPGTNMNYGNTFVSCNIERVFDGIVITSTNVSHNVFNGGQISYYGTGGGYGIIGAGSYNSLYGVNFINSTNFVTGTGVSVMNGSHVAGTTLVQDMTALGNATITGTLAKGGGSFDIAHPDPSKQNWRLRHCFVEAPTRGDNIYRYTVLVRNGYAEIELPDYFAYLNENAQVWVSPCDILSYGMGYVKPDNKTVIITTKDDGYFNVLIIATRKDELMVNYWDRNGGAEIPPPQQENN
jgi:hypothetical protein